MVREEEREFVVGVLSDVFVCFLGVGLARRSPRNDVPTGRGRTWRPVDGSQESDLAHRAQQLTQMEAMGGGVRLGH